MAEAPTTTRAAELAALEPNTHEARNLVRVALIAAQAAAQAVAKEGHNDWHGYKYATAESVFAEAKMVLAAQGLGLQCVARRIERPLVESSVGTMVKQWKLVHTSGEEILYPEWQWPIVIDRGRPFDKAVAAAETACRHYFTLDLLQINRTEKGTDLDDPGRDEGGNNRVDDKPRATPKKNQKAPPKDRERDDGDEIPEFMKKRGNDLIAQLGITSDVKEFIEKLNKGAPVENKAQMRMVLAELELRVKAKKKSSDAAGDAPQAAG